jgi:hypothetical protein
MTLTRRNLLIVALAAMPFTPSAFAQKASPAGKAEVTLAGSKVTIAYSRPYVKGRKIVGGLVPYGRVWRTGADEATALTTATDLEIGNAKVPAGSYTIYTLPSEGTWKLIINRQTGQWGTEYDESKDLARVDLTKASVPAPVEEFTISFVKKGPKAAELILEWENTKLSVPVRVTR